MAVRAVTEQCFHVSAQISSILSITFDNATIICYCADCVVSVSYSSQCCDNAGRCCTGENAAGTRL